MSRNTNNGRPCLEFEDAKVIFRNFRGEDYGYNAQHKKGFSILLNPDDYDIKGMIADGWNIKPLKPREGYEDEGVNYHLPVEVRWDKLPPVIWLITQTGISEEGRPRYKRTKLDEESSFVIDTADVIQVQVKISGNSYDVNGNTGIKAYLKEMFIELAPDRFEAMYDWDED